MRGYMIISIPNTKLNFVDLYRKEEVIYSIDIHELLYIFTPASIPITIYTSSIFKYMVAIWIAIHNMCAFWAQRHHVGTRP